MKRKLDLSKLPFEIPKELIELLENTESDEEMDRLEAESEPTVKDPVFVASMLKGDIVTALHQIMEAESISQNQLAERLGKSRQWVSRILNESDNFTVATIAKLACAVGLVPKLVFEPVPEIQPARTKASGTRKLGKSKVKSVGARKTTRIDKAATSVREAAAKYKTARRKKKMGKS